MKRLGATRPPGVRSRDGEHSGFSVVTTKSTATATVAAWAR